MLFAYTLISLTTVAFARVWIELRYIEHMHEFPRNYYIDVDYTDKFVMRDLGLELLNVERDAGNVATDSNYYEWLWTFQMFGAFGLFLVALYFRSPKNDPGVNVLNAGFRYGWVFSTVELLRALTFTVTNV